MYCSECGHSLVGDQTSCSECGRPTNASNVHSRSSPQIACAAMGTAKSSVRDAEVGAVHRIRRSANTTIPGLKNVRAVGRS